MFEYLLFDEILWLDYRYLSDYLLTYLNMALGRSGEPEALKYYLKCPKNVYCACPNAWNIGGDSYHIA